jgi:hypothetical protein
MPVRRRRTTTRTTRRRSYSSDSSSDDAGEYKKRRNPRLTASGLIDDRYDSDSSSSSSSSGLSLDSDDDSSDSDYGSKKRKDCSKRTDGKCVKASTGRCVAPNVRSVYGKNDDHIGLTYNQFKTQLGAMSIADRKSTLCQLGNRNLDTGAYPCPDAAEYIIAALGIKAKLGKGKTKCDKLVHFILDTIDKASGRHYTIDPEQIPVTKDSDVIVHVTYRGYSKRTIVVSKTMDKSAFTGGIHVYHEGSLSNGTASYNVFVTSRI